MRALAIVVLFFSGVLGPGGEIANHYRVQMQAKPDATPKEPSDSPVDYTKHGVTEIGLERTPCEGTCPVYTLVIDSSGAVRYTGESNAPKKGAWRGKISVGEFNRLAQFMCDCDFMGVDDGNDGRSSGDGPLVYTTFVLNGTRKTVRDKGYSPNKVWAIERLIDGLIKDVKWDSGVYSPPNTP